MGLAPGIRPPCGHAAWERPIGKCRAADWAPGPARVRNGEAGAPCPGRQALPARVRLGGGERGLFGRVLAWGIAAARGREGATKVPLKALSVAALPGPGLLKSATRATEERGVGPSRGATHAPRLPRRELQGRRLHAAGSDWPMGASERYPAQHRTRGRHRPVSVKGFGRGAGNAEAGGNLLGEGISQLVAAFLRSQCSDCAKLEVRVTGGPKDLLTGHVPEAHIRAEDACFKGLHISRLSLSAERIQLQLPSLMKKAEASPPPSILRQHFAVQATAHMTPDHLRASLSSPLLHGSLSRLLSLGRRQEARLTASELSVHAGDNGILTFTGFTGPSASRQQLSSVASSVVQLRVSLLPSGQHIRLQRVLPPGAQSSDAGADEMVFDLGKETRLQSLSVDSQGLQLQGTFMVSP